MRAVNRITGPGAGIFPVLAILMLALSIGPRAATAQQGAHLASLNPGRPSSALPSNLEREPANVGRVAEVKTVAEALVLLQKLEAQLRAAPQHPVDLVRIQQQAEAAGRFFREIQARKNLSARYQWHGVSRIRPEPGATHLILRPMHAVPFVSAVEIDVSGGPVRIDVIRAYGASGVVYEFHPQRLFGATAMSGPSRLCLDREIRLTAVEIFCKGVEHETLELAVQGGIAVEPASAAERGGLQALQIARAEIERNRFREASRHIQRSMAYLKTLPQG